ncbi:hypothetical protein RUM44_008115, partial [Polyplax serrata]
MDEATDEKSQLQSESIHSKEDDWEFQIKQEIVQDPGDSIPSVFRPPLCRNTN